MSQLLNIFDCSETKQYFVDDDGVLWLHGHLTCQRLGFKNPSRDIQLHTEVDERQKVSLGGLEDVWFVSEYGVWGMALVAKTVEAKNFKRYLKRDVLPAIRTKGGYIAPTASSEQLEALQAEISTIQQERDKAIWQRDRAEFSMGLSTAELQDLKAELSFIYSEALPQFVEIVNKLTIIGLEFENSLRDDLADFRCDMAHKRIKSEKYFDNPKLMPSSKTSLATLRRELNKLEEKKLLPKVTKLLELLAKKSDTALTVL
jgi:prophage antirepressor-like protein